jgi:TRAP-type mannitol/chloroaromatic compound transport system permease small subunit
VNQLSTAPSLIIAGASLIDKLNETLGKIISWAALGLILTQFALVLIHYIFHETSIFMQESLLYMHSLIFLGGAGYTLLHNGHVRVDVAYSHFSPKAKAYVNLIGCIIFLFPVCGFIGYYAWPYVVSSWDVLESSQELGGIPAVFILKSFILLFSFNMMLQGLSIILNSILTIGGTDTPPEEKMEAL